MRSKITCTLVSAVASLLISCGQNPPTQQAEFGAGVIDKVYDPTNGTNPNRHGMAFIYPYWLGRSAAVAPGTTINNGVDSPANTRPVSREGFGTTGRRAGA